MAIYTKSGDGGTTSLMGRARVPKFDERVELMGNIDELNSQLGLVKSLSCDKGRANIEIIQWDLMKIMSGIADSSNSDVKVSDSMIETLESKIDKTENLFPREHNFVLYGKCEASAHIDIARAIARRVERRFCKVAQIYGADNKAIVYMNRLSDYLYVLARYIDFQN